MQVNLSSEMINVIADALWLMQDADLIQYGEITNLDALAFFAELQTVDRFQ